MDRKIPVAFQLYAVRFEVEKDLAATLKGIAAAGYSGAELYGYDGKALTWKNHPVKDVRKMYDDAGLKCCGMHLGTDALMGDNLKRTVEFNRVLGSHLLIIAGDGKRMANKAGVLDLAAILNNAAKLLKAEKLYPGYHAHADDFHKLDGEIAWDVLFSNTGPDVVMQLDTGNCIAGGGDPVATLKRFPNRTRSMHLKENGPAGSIIGEGKVDWKTVFALCQTQQNTEWYVVEEGEDPGKGFEIAKRCMTILRGMGVA